MAEVQYVGASRIYPGNPVPAVNHLNLDVADGEFLVLVGPSGSGKSTALRMLAGLEDVDEGEIRIGGQGRIATSRRRTGTSRWCSRTTRSTRT